MRRRLPSRADPIRRNRRHGRPGSLRASRLGRDRRDACRRTGSGPLGQGPRTRADGEAVSQGTDGTEGRRHSMGPTGHGRGYSKGQLWSWLIIVALVVALIIVERQRLAFLFGVLIFVVALLTSVMLHELGHFATAKKFGMRVTQFFVGFGKTLWSTFRGETEYGVKALPFGGFVKITGMTSAEDVDLAHEPRSFRNQPGWQRIIVLAAGSFMHFVLAMFLLFVLAFGIGQANSNTNVVSSIAACVPASVTALKSANPCAGHNLGKSPAQIAGLRPGDKIISVDGKPVGTWTQLHTVLAAQQTNVSVPIVVTRNGQDMHLSVKLAA